MLKLMQRRHQLPLFFFFRTVERAETIHLVLTFLKSSLCGEVGWLSRSRLGIPDRKRIPEKLFARFKPGLLSGKIS
jgi:hypothetical protein